MATPLAAVCPGCFRHKGGEVAVCPHCGYDAAAARSPLLLPVLTRLSQRYLIGRTLGKPGGFGVTYLGLDLTLQVKVAIKEYCPRDLVGRDTSRRTLAPHSQEDGELFQVGKQAFLDEARTLAKFDHANVVRVRDFFEANGTAYLVMDYYEGESLLEYLTRQGGKLPWRTALDLMLPVLDGLREVHHQGFLHRDVKPHNIYLTSQGRPILLDFGSARQAMGERSRSMSVMLTEGYAPFEQYHRRGGQGPWTDIYGAAATLYLLVTGQTPPPAPERIRHDELVSPRQLVPDLPQPLNTALLHGLATDPQKRSQTMAQFEQWLHGIVDNKEQVTHASPPDSADPNSLPVEGKFNDHIELRRQIQAQLAVNKRATLYGVLGLLPTCSESDISQKSVEILSDAEKSGTLLSTEIQYAMNILQDDRKRKEYDKKLWDSLSIKKTIVLEEANEKFFKNKLTAIVGVILIIIFGYFSKEIFYSKNTDKIETVIVQEKPTEIVQDPTSHRVQIKKLPMEEPVKNRPSMQGNSELTNNNESHYRASLEAEFNQKRQEQERWMEMQAREQQRLIELQNQQQERFMEFQREEQQRRKKAEKDRQADNQLRYWSCVNAMMEKGRSGSAAQSYCRNN